MTESESQAPTKEVVEKVPDEEALAAAPAKKASATVKFNRNGGSGTLPENISASVGDQITIPSNTLTKSGFVFVGWSTDYQATGEGPGHYGVPVYSAGDEYTVTKGGATLYAAWAKENVGANFFIRLDGTIPTEPQGHSASEYTNGIHISNVIKIGKFYTDSTKGVAEYLNGVPTDAQIKAVYPSYDSNSQYVMWYVIKNEQGGWHIDGVLLDKSKVNLSYNPNAPAGTWSNMPDGNQYVKDSIVTVSTKTPTRSGYTFTGWNTNANGTGTAYSGGQTFKITKDTTLYAQWEPKNGTKYTVEYYYEEEGEYPETATSSVERTGTTEATANVKDSDKTPAKDGYVFDSKAENVLSGTIAGDGSLVLKVYFKQQYTVTYNLNGGSSAEQLDYPGLHYGAPTPTIDAPTRAGYTFAGWSPAVENTVKGDAEYVAQWTPIQVSVIIHYVDEDGNAVAGDYSTTINYGEGFSQNSPNITGYELVNKEDITVGQTSIIEDFEYTVVYKKIPIPIPTPDPDNPKAKSVKEWFGMGDGIVQTGDMGVPEIAAFAGLGALILALLIFFCGRKRKKNDNLEKTLKDMRG